jgi:hypothetical protein
MTGMSILYHVPKNSFFSGSRASECRKIDPATGEVIGIVARLPPDEVEKAQAGCVGLYCGGGQRGQRRNMLGA